MDHFQDKHSFMLCDIAVSIVVFLFPFLANFYQKEWHMFMFIHRMPIWVMLGKNRWRNGQTSFLYVNVWYARKCKPNDNLLKWVSQSANQFTMHTTLNNLIKLIWLSQPLALIFLIQFFYISFAWCWHLKFVCIPTKLYGKWMLTM